MKIALRNYTHLKNLFAGWGFSYMKIAIINTFDTYNERMFFVYNYFNREDNDVKIIQSLFSHRYKTNIEEKCDNVIYIKTFKYKKNISIKRIFSHILFSVKCKKIIKDFKPDLLYIIIPSNSNLKIGLSDKKNNYKIVYDVMDLWPETFPVKMIKTNTIYKHYIKKRNQLLGNSSQIITECELFKDELKTSLISSKIDTIYLTKKVEYPHNSILSDEVVNILYLGSINNIIDIEKIKYILSEINSIRKTNLYVIGNGLKKEQLILEVRQFGIDVIDCGVTFDHNIKQQVFSKCHFGLNVMKREVFIGLSMKSVDYFQYNLPIINTVCGDTELIIEKYNTGFNVHQDISKLIDMIKKMDLQDFYIQKKNCSKVFNELFIEEKNYLKLDKLIKKLL